MPQLVKLQSELKDTGFVIIAPHAQNGTSEEVAAMARQLKVNFTVVGQGNIPGEKIEGIPAAFLFDSSGKLVAKGSPGSVKAKAHELAQSEPHFLAAGRKYTKQRAMAESLKKTKAYGSILKKLEKDLKGEGDAAAEAKYLTDKIAAYGKKRLDEAKGQEGDDPFAAQQGLTELSTQFKGHEVGDQASARLKELKADKEFQAELKASTIAHQILAECDKLVSQEGKINLEYGPNKTVAAGVKASVQALKKKYPDSKAASKIGSLVGTYGFTGM